MLAVIGVVGGWVVDVTATAEGGFLGEGGGVSCCDELPRECWLLKNLLYG